MKKLLMSALCLFLFGSVSLMAQAHSHTGTEVQSETAHVVSHNPETEVSTAELPAEVRATLQGQDYQGWTIKQAFQMEKEGNQFYKVLLVKGDQETKVKLKANGEVVTKQG